MNDRTLVLCSGGLDSVVVAALLLEEERKVGLLNVRYGSRAEASETKAVHAVAAHFAQKYGHCAVITVDVPGLFGKGSGLLASNVAALPAEDLAGAAAWVPARNLVLVSAAVVQAVLYGYGSVAIGNVADGIYPDNKPAFTRAFNHLLPHACGKEHLVSLVAPVNHLEKFEVVTLGDKLGVPFGLTWSCYESGEKPCGKCGSCVSRMRAFKTALSSDPTQYA